MLEASIGKFTYDSDNRLITADTRYYAYDVEGTRIKTQRGEDVTKFIYNVNARLSQLLVMTENNAETKYVYGLGLIGEEVSGNFKVYHFDYRGSTVAITNASGTVTDTFEYDTYGKLKSRTGTTKTPFLYNGRDGVMSEDDTGLIYMRARYYSPELRRFINADKVHGDISNALTLNRYSFCNGNPAVNVDPEGLKGVDARGGSNGDGTTISPLNPLTKKYRKLRVGIKDNWFYNVESIFDPMDDVNAIKLASDTTTLILNNQSREFVHEFLRSGITEAVRPNNIGPGTWAKECKAELKYVDDALGAGSKLAKGLDILGYAGDALDVGLNVYENIQNGTDAQRIVTDAMVDVGVNTASGVITSIVSSSVAGFAAGFVAPGVGNLIGGVLGALIGIGFSLGLDSFEVNDKSLIDWAKDGVDWVVDGIAGWFD